MDSIPKKYFRSIQRQSFFKGMKHVSIYNFNQTEKISMNDIPEEYSKIIKIFSGEIIFES